MISPLPTYSPECVYRDQLRQLRRQRGRTPHNQVAGPQIRCRKVPARFERITRPELHQQGFQLPILGRGQHRLRAPSQLDAQVREVLADLAEYGGSWSWQQPCQVLKDCHTDTQ